MAVKNYQISINISRVDSGSTDENSPVYTGLLDEFERELSKMHRQRGSYHIIINSVSEI